MNAEGLLQHYERIADAPDAIGQLRQFILDLAVRGKLVPQDAGEEPVLELLRRIAAKKVERKRMTGDARIKVAPEPVADDLPMPLPHGWAVQSFENLFLFIDYRGNTPPKTTEGVPLITAKNVRPGVLNREPREFISAGTFKTWMTRGTPRLGDLFFTTEAPLANVCLNDIAEPFALAQRVICLQPYGENNPRFFMLALMSDAMQSVIDAHATGMTAKGIKAAKLKPLPIPIPPLAEQDRIVAKVDELMALCDRLEAARTKREATRDRLAAASLARLNAPDPKTFHEDARFALHALPALTARPDQIKQLRQTILNLAVRGKLSPPGAWTDRLTPLAEVASLQNGYAFKSEWFSTSGIRLLRNANVSHETLDWSDVVYLPALRAAEFERFELRAGDVVLSLDRPFIGTGTKVARVSKGDLPALLLQRVGRFVLSAELNPDYLFMWIQSPHFSDQIDPGRSNGVPHISSKQVEQAVLHVPPVAEQRRIVAKVDGLIALCDQLEASLASGADRRRRVLGALLQEALAPTVELEQAAA